MNRAFTGRDKRFLEKLFSLRRQEPFLDATHLNAGVYNGNLTIACNSLNDPISNVPVTLTVTGGGGYQYIVGDVNNNGAFNGIDISYGVGYFKGGPAPVPCPQCPPSGYSAGISPIVPTVQPQKINSNIGAE